MKLKFTVLSGDPQEVESVTRCKIPIMANMADGNEENAVDIEVNICYDETKDYERSFVHYEYKDIKYNSDDTSDLLDEVYSNLCDLFPGNSDRINEFIDNIDEEIVNTIDSSKIQY